MDNDIDLQVWLEATTAAQTSVIVPHVRSDKAGPLQYAIRTVQESRGNRSTIGQSGQIYIQADITATLSKLVIRRHNGDTCQVNITLDGPDNERHEFDFKCPDPIYDGRFSQ